jgi:hypothetical protein
VQRYLSDQQHRALLSGLKARSDTRTKNLLLACSMPHASDGLAAGTSNPRPRLELA